MTITGRQEIRWPTGVTKSDLQHFATLGSCAPVAAGDKPAPEELAESVAHLLQIRLRAFLHHVDANLSARLSIYVYGSAAIGLHLVDDSENYEDGNTAVEISILGR